MQEKYCKKKLRETKKKSIDWKKYSENERERVRERSGQFMLRLFDIFMA
jgi:hypothetical protein